MKQSLLFHGFALRCAMRDAVGCVFIVFRLYSYWTLLVMLCTAYPQQFKIVFSYLDLPFMGKHNS